MLFDLVVWMTVHNEQVDVAVIIVVEEFHAPSTHQPGNPANAHRSGHVVEPFVVVVSIYGLHLLVPIGNQQILPAILIEICRLHAPPGARPSLLAEAHTKWQADRRGFSVLLSRR